VVSRLEGFFNICKAKNYKLTKNKRCGKIKLAFLNNYIYICMIQNYRHKKIDSDSYKKKRNQIKDKLNKADYTKLENQQLLDKIYNLIQSML